MSENQCPRCGGAVPPAALFCPFCGHSLSASAPGGVCTVCGATLAAGASECAVCGCPYSAAVEAVSAEKTGAEKNVRRKKNNIGCLIITWILMAVLVLMVLFYGIFIVITNP